MEFNVEKIKNIFANRNTNKIIDHSLRKASILLPIVLIENEPCVLFTERTALVKRHKKQICFPGGGVEKKDNSPIEAMFREVEEEIGVNKGSIELLGRMDDYVSGTGYLIHPYVGFLKRIDLGVSNNEVSDVFTVPLKFFFDDSNHYRSFIDYRESAFPIHVFTYERKVIWGITGGLVNEFVNILKS